ncbi:hypothetical protein IV203_022358 [Nitzschia inconspicua]|uniref:Uncharacterized protein n=1 Tax=Nitzschia inconspicua TaxID=303405 RepID=A0A9K3PEL4_9STRA|nr:hypothetical protein IV203_022358 [Nitzschia inconspicua]
MTEEQAEVTVIRTKRKRNRPKKKNNNKNKKDPSKSSDAKDNDSITVGSDSDVSPRVSQVNESSTTRPATTILTPQESLRQSLITQGFSVHDIDQAMEKMWDNGLAYDQYDAVLTFLQTGGQILDDKEEGDGRNVEKEIGDQATVQTASTDDAAEEAESMSNSAAGDDDDVDVESTSKASPSFRKTSLAEKLNMVARADKVTDAIFALTQWITKAAKPHELEELCLAQKTRALVTVFQRGMEECIDQSMFDTAVLPGLVRLISSTFRRCGIKFEGEQLASAEHSIASLVRQTRKVIMMKPMDETDTSNSNEIADKVATFIVFRMAQALEEAQFVLEMPSPAIARLPSLPRKSQDDHVSSLIKKGKHKNRPPRGLVLSHKAPSTGLFNRIMASRCQMTPINQMMSAMVMHFTTPHLNLWMTQQKHGLRSAKCDWMNSKHEFKKVKARR